MNLYGLCEQGKMNTLCNSFHEVIGVGHFCTHADFTKINLVTYSYGYTSTMLIVSTP